MNIALDDLINDFPNEEDTIIKLLYYEAKNFEQQSNQNFRLLEKSRTQAVEQQVIIDELNSALAETTRQYEAMLTANTPTETLDPTDKDTQAHIRQLLNDNESYKRIINSLNDQINSLREMEQSYEAEIINLKDTNISLKSQLENLEIEYQGLNVKYDSLMQNSILPMEAIQ